jgi:hypothetical protein
MDNCILDVLYCTLLKKIWKAVTCGGWTGNTKFIIFVPHSFEAYQIQKEVLR